MKRSRHLLLKLKRGGIKIRLSSSFVEIVKPSSVRILNSIIKDLFSHNLFKQTIILRPIFYKIDDLYTLIKSLQIYRSELKIVLIDPVLNSPSKNTLRNNKGVEFLTILGELLKLSHQLSDILLIYRASGFKIRVDPDKIYPNDSRYILNTLSVTNTLNLFLMDDKSDPAETLSKIFCKLDGSLLSVDDSRRIGLSSLLKEATEISREPPSSDNNTLFGGIENKNRRFEISDGFLISERELMEKRLRYAGKFETNNEIEAKYAHRILKKVFPYVSIVRRDSKTIDLYYSLNREYVKEISEVDNILEAQYIRKAGRLFGYPDCCVEAYLQSSFHLLPTYLYKWMVKRYEEPEEIDKTINPFLLGPNYFPCSLKCSHTIKRLKIIAKYMLSKEQMEYLNYPILFLFPSNHTRPLVRGYQNIFNFVVLNTKEVGEDGFDYTPHYASGNDFRLSIIMNSNRLTFKDGIVRIYYNKRLIYEFLIEANIWYYKRVFDYEFFNRLLGLTMIQIKSGSLVLPLLKGYERLKEVIDLLYFKRIIFPFGFFINTRAIQDRNIIITNLINNKREHIQVGVQLKEDAKMASLYGQKIALSILKSRADPNSFTPLLHTLLTRIETGI